MPWDIFANKLYKRIPIINNILQQWSSLLMHNKNLVTSISKLEHAAYFVLNAFGVGIAWASIHSPARDANLHE